MSKRLFIMVVCVAICILAGAVFFIYSDQPALDEPIIGVGDVLEIDSSSTTENFQTEQFGFSSSSEKSVVSNEVNSSALETELTKNNPVPAETQSQLPPPPTVDEYGGYDDWVPEATLGIQLDGLHEPYLVTPDGSVVGIDPNTGQKVQTSDRVKGWSVVDYTSGFGLVNPLSGTYTLIDSAGDGSDYLLEVMFASKNHEIYAPFRAVHSTGGTKVTFDLDVSASSREAPLDFYNTIQAPYSVAAFDDNNETLLIWKKPPSASPTRYRVYTKAFNESKYSLLSETASTRFSTNHEWAGANEDVGRCYVVSSVFADGAESFLSFQACNNDADHDDLEDKLELELGSKIELVDTDGDGVSDGDEYLDTGTDPTKKDTNGDGVEDSVQSGLYYSSDGRTPEFYLQRVKDSETINQMYSQN